MNLQKNYTTTVSRGDVAQLIVNLLEKCMSKPIEEIMTDKNVQINNSVFTDTEDKAILSANALGIINGVGGGTFDPNGTLTRAQIAAILNRITGTMGQETDGFSHGFTDVAGHWVDTELGWPVHAEIINGVGNNMFDPEGNLTIEQVIALTYRALSKLTL